MKKQLLVWLLICAGVQITAAQQKNADAERENRSSMRKEMIEARKEQRGAPDSAVQVAGVGDPESFGKNVKFLGNGLTDAVYVYRSCDPAVLLDELQLTLAPGDRCVVHTGGATTTAVFDDLGSITLPGRSADNLITYVVNSTIFNDYENLNLPTQLFTSFIYAPRLTIESSALNDPAAVNPSTGLPLNGSVTFSLGGSSKFETRTIQPGSFESYDDNRSHVATRGLSRSYFSEIGLPARVIDNLYRQPMTIKFGMRISVRNVFYGQYFYSARFLGN